MTLLHWIALVSRWFAPSPSRLSFVSLGLLFEVFAFLHTEVWNYWGFRVLGLSFWLVQGPTDRILVAVYCFSHMKYLEKEQSTSQSWDCLYMRKPHAVLSEDLFGWSYLAFHLQSYGERLLLDWPCHLQPKRESRFRPIHSLSSHSIRYTREVNWPVSGSVHNR